MYIVCSHLKEKKILISVCVEVWFTSVEWRGVMESIYSLPRANESCLSLWNFLCARQFLSSVRKMFVNLAMATLTER